MAREYAVCASRREPPVRRDVLARERGASVARELSVAGVVVAGRAARRRSRQVEGVDHRRRREEIGIRALVERVAVRGGRDRASRRTGTRPSRAGRRPPARARARPRPACSGTAAQDAGVSVPLVQGRWHGDGGVSPDRGREQPVERRRGSTTGRCRRRAARPRGRATTNRGSRRSRRGTSRSARTRRCRRSTRGARRAAGSRWGCRRSCRACPRRRSRAAG